MKKLLSLFVPLLALMLAFTPQSAQAQIDEYLKVIGSSSGGSVTVKATGTPEEFPDLWYKLDDGNWVQVLEPCSISIPTKGVSDADVHTLRLKGTNPTGFNHSSTNFISMSIGGNCALAGNVMSLIGGDNFSSLTTIPCDYCFYALFCPYPPSSFSTSYSSYVSTTSNLSKAHELVLPATTLTAYCYAYMFAGNSGLYTGPSLPATVMQPWCYAHMFENCINNFYSSTAANSGWYFSSMHLPAQQLAEGCYAFMFSLCGSIYNNDANNYYILPAEELAPKCYMGMFSLYGGISGGTDFRYLEIMATSLKDRRGDDITNCMAYMFNNAVWANTSNGRQNLNLRMYWTDWGDATTGPANDQASSAAPTYGWFYGNVRSGNVFQYQNGLGFTTSLPTNSTSTYNHTFPKNGNLTSTNYTYLTFDCKTNGGTWESGSTYKDDLRRVVRKNYTAKTIPAPPVKANARFLGWFTTASGDGSMLTESQLKQITTATTVFARFVDNDKYTFFVNPSDKATITVTDNSSNSYTPGTLYILDSNDKTFTLSCTGVTSGWSFYKWTGGTFTDNNVQFGAEQKDLLISAIITGTPNFSAADVTVYQVGTSEGRSNAITMPDEAVDLGDAGIWAKYNVDKTTSNGFAASETAAGGYYSWGMETAATESAVNALYSSMTDGDNLPVTEEADVAYKYCGHKWRIPTKDEWQTLLDNTTVVGPTNTSNNNSNVSGKMQTFTSKSNGNQMILPPNGYYSGASGPYFGNSIDYWSRTRGLTQGAGNTAYGYGGTLSGSTIVAPTLGNNTVNGTGYYYYAVGIRPILNVNKRTLTVHADGHTYYFDCDLYQTVTVTAEADEDEGYKFARWKDEAGNVFSTNNPLVVNVYDNLTYTAEFEEVVGEKRTVTFYDDDMTTPLYSEQRTEGLMPVYRGSTPTKEGYIFAGWTPAFEVIGATDVNYYATYHPLYTVTFYNYNGDILDQQHLLEGETPVYGGVAPTKTNWYFNGWSPDIQPVGTSDVSYIATYRDIESADESVNVYENVSANITKILHSLNPVTVNNITYTPIDLGYGVAWADRNLGASTPSAVGDYYRWGATTAGNCGSSTSSNAPIVQNINFTNGDTLPPTADAATVILGNNWKMPNDNEFTALINNTTLKNNNRFENKTDDSKYIELYAGGYKYNTGSNVYGANYQHYWSNKAGRGYEGNSQKNCAYALVRRASDNKYYVQTQDKAYTTNKYAMETFYGTPIRAIYTPQYTTYTLTIQVGSNKYKYKCQAGQNITVTAHATTEGYVFDKWTEDNDTHATRTFAVTGNMTYTATFKEAPSVTTYNVTIVSNDTEYGTVNESAINGVESGTGITVSGSTLTIGSTTVTATKHADDAQYTYAFTGWTDDEGEDLPESVTDDLTIRANFTQTLNTYTVTWKDEDGTTILKTDASVAYGATPSFGSENPTRPSDLVYSYTFAGWNDGTTTYETGAALPAVTDDVTYTAVFNSEDIVDFDLVDDVDAGGTYNGHNYYAALDALSELTTTRRVTYKRSMESGKWHVVSLPFNFSLVQNNSHKFAGNIYELNDVTYDNSGYLDLNFTPVWTMTANVPYVYYNETENYSGAVDAANEKFEGVQFVARASAPVVKDLTKGTISFVNTIVRTQLNSGDRKQIYIYNNHLHYPTSNGDTYIRAFRGYFQMSDDAVVYHPVAPRVRIVLNGQTATELEFAPDMQDGNEVRKYIENGVLVIEREGVKYNAQGARME